MADKQIRGFKDYFIDAVIISSSLIVVFYSGYYHTMLLQLDESLIESGLSHLLSVLSIVSVAATLALGVVHRRITVPIFHSVFFGVCFLSQLALFIGGTTDIFSSEKIEMFLLALTFPQASYMSLFNHRSAWPSLIITAVLALASVLSAIAVRRLGKRDANG
ncbi:MAG: hypothetical protein KBT31_01650 [Firmicutes bacterium]|nr:hypothetical protein [Candidatus Colimorpha enterica]